MNFSFGGDPELFLANEQGAFVSAEDADGPLIPGTKEKPYPVKGGAIQVDGVAAEFNINPASTGHEFYENILDTVTELRAKIREKNDKLSLRPVPTAHFDPDYFKKLPAKVKMLGCDPDFNAWKEGAENPRPKTRKPMRTGSGHIGIGWDICGDYKGEAHLKDSLLMVKAHDLILYPASLEWDKDNERRQLYGKIGSFRPKPWGVEYRVLSNAWLKKRETILTVFRLSQAIAQKVDSGKFDFSVKVEPGIDNAYRALGRMG